MDQKNVIVLTYVLYCALTLGVIVLLHLVSKQICKFDKSSHVKSKKSKVKKNKQSKAKVPRSRRRKQPKVICVVDTNVDKKASMVTGIDAEFEIDTKGELKTPDFNVRKAPTDAITISATFNETEQAKDSGKTNAALLPKFEVIVPERLCVTESGIKFFAAGQETIIGSAKVKEAPMIAGHKNTVDRLTKRMRAAQADVVIAEFGDGIDADFPVKFEIDTDSFRTLAIIQGTRERSPNVPRPKLNAATVTTRKTIPKRSEKWDEKLMDFVPLDAVPQEKPTTDAQSATIDNTPQQDHVSALTERHTETELMTRTEDRTPLNGPDGSTFAGDAETVSDDIVSIHDEETSPSGPPTVLITSTSRRPIMDAVEVVGDSTRATYEVKAVEDKWTQADIIELEEPVLIKAAKFELINLLPALDLCRRQLDRVRPIAEKHLKRDHNSHDRDPKR